MLDSDGIISQTNADTSEVSPSSGNRLYITSILKAENLIIDGTNFGPIGPIELFSPIVCDSFTPNSARHVSYFQQGPIGLEYL